MSPVIAGGATIFAGYAGRVREVKRAGNKATLTEYHYVCAASDAGRAVVAVASGGRWLL